MERMRKSKTKMENGKRIWQTQKEKYEKIGGGLKLMLMMMLVWCVKDIELLFKIIHDFISHKKKITSVKRR
jgi:hypothetical protein